jgi:hypothetical protein
MKDYLQISAIVIFIYVLSSCSSIEYQSPRYVQLAHKITDQTGKQLKKEKGLILVGTGGGMMNDIQMMAMSFFVYQELSLSESREMVVYAAKKYLENINAKEEIRAHLHNNPFTARDIEITLFIYNLDQSSLAPDKIYYISMLKGILSYYAKIPDKTKPLHKESYEEALEIVNSENNSLSKAG